MLASGVSRREVREGGRLLTNYVFGKASATPRALREHRGRKRRLQRFKNLESKRRVGRATDRGAGVGEMASRRQSQIL